jgi:hypothetical protein
MPGFSSTAFLTHLPLFKRLGRRTPTRGTKASRLHSPISILNDDVLLNIFHLYRLDRLRVAENQDERGRDEHDEEPSNHLGVWRRQDWWYKLTHVSRRWRCIILSSPCTLDLHLICTERVPVAEMLRNSPPLPLILFYKGEVTTEARDEIITAFSHRDRVRRIMLWISPRNLEKLIPAMDAEFPILERLTIVSNPELEGLMLPRKFQAPKLRQIILDGVRVALPKRYPLFTSTGGLVYLMLRGTSRPAYLPPNVVHTQLSFMPRLRTLCIKFDPNCHHHNVVDSPRIMTPVTLPNLRVFAFKGGSAYLESLLSGVSAPVLTSVEVTFLHQLDFPIPHLFQFIQSTKFLRFREFRLDFWGVTDYFPELPFQRVCLIADPCLVSGERLEFRITCSHLNQQVASAVRALGTLSPLLSVVEQLNLTYTIWDMEADGAAVLLHGIDRIQWRELLRSFSGVKTLHVKKELIGGVSQSLRSKDGEQPLELLPNLKHIGYSGCLDSHVHLFMPFINERQAAGHPVNVSLVPVSVFDTDSQRMGH